MENLSIRTRGQKGGIVWLAVAILLVLLWAKPSNMWLASAAGWVTVVAGWIGRKRIRRELSTSDALGAAAVLALFAAFAWACSEAFVQLRLRLYNPFGPESPFGATLEPLSEGREWTVALAIGLLIAFIGGAWLLSSAVPAASKDAGIRIHTILRRSFGQLKRSRAAGSFAGVAGMATVAAAMIGSQAGTPWRIAAGLAVAYVQIYLLALADRPKPEQAKPASENVTKVSKRGRRNVLIALFALHFVLLGFYIFLFGALNGWSWKVAALYPLSWISGCIYALIAWLFSLSRIVYATVMIAIGLACAILLGMIAGAYDWDLLAYIR